MRSKFALVTPGPLSVIISETPSGKQTQAARNPPIRSKRFFVIYPKLPDAARLVKKAFQTVDWRVGRQKQAAYNNAEKAEAKNAAPRRRKDRR
jgi:hypothetical protein